MPPTPATVMTVPSAADRRTSDAESPIHARPADQIVPDASPKAARARSRTAKPGAAAIPAVERMMSTPAARVTRRDPSRSDSRPAGIDAITIASGAAARSAPAAVVDRSYARVYPGSSGTRPRSAISSRKTSAYIRTNVRRMPQPYRPPTGARPARARPRWVLLAQQFWLSRIGPSRFPKKYADGPPYWLVRPKVLPFRIWPNSQTHSPFTLACVHHG